MTTAPIIMSVLFGGADQAWFDDQRRRHFPPERNVLAAHCTMFHHLAPELAVELKRRLAAATRGVAAPRAELAGLMNLGRGVAYRIVSPELEALRADLADAFATMLVPQDRAGWRPHVTIQNKVEPADARALLARLTPTFHPRTLAVAGIGTWWYRGGPWEPLSRHMFA